MNRFRVVYKYFQHILTARWSYGFRVHSPFIFNFTKYVIYEKNPYYVFPPIEKRREELKRDNRIIGVTDFGTGKSGRRKVSDIANKSLKSAKFSQLLFRIAKESRAQTILELGTSLGITTAYLAAADRKAKCITMEGCPETAGIAQETFKKFGLSNIELMVGDINKNLPELLEDTEQLDLIFFDANHSSEAVLSYFEQCLGHIRKETILIVDDIYWSKDMESAWKEIKENDKVTATIDLFQLGIVFFNSDLHKKHYKMLL